MANRVKKSPVGSSTPTDPVVVVDDPVAEPSKKVKKDQSNRPEYWLVGESIVTGQFAIVWKEPTVGRSRRIAKQMHSAFAVSYRHLRWVRVKAVDLDDNREDSE